MRLKEHEGAERSRGSCSDFLILLQTNSDLFTAQKPSMGGRTVDILMETLLQGQQRPAQVRQFPQEEEGAGGTPQLPRGSLSKGRCEEGAEALGPVRESWSHFCLSVTLGAEQSACPVVVTSPKGVKMASQMAKKKKSQILQWFLTLEINTFSKRIRYMYGIKISQGQEEIRTGEKSLKVSLGGQ